MRRLALAAIAAAVGAFATDAAATPTPAAPLAIGAPAGPARALALTDDGKTAVSADFTGHLRLWPSLDGTREPVVVTANPPVEVAIARDGDDVVIAGLDVAGGLELVRTTQAGAPGSRAPLDAERPAVALLAAGDRVIARRDDGAIALFDLHGARTAVLVAAPGERIGTIVARRDRALALIITPDGMRGRWLDLAADRWGDETPMLPIAPGLAALSPDLRHLAAIAPPRRGFGDRTVIVDVATGKVTARAELYGLENSETVSPIGFVDAKTLAVARDSGTLVWWRNGAESPVSSDVAGAAAVADGRAIGSMNSSLVISNFGAVHYLGYRLIGSETVRPVRGGLLVSDGATIVRVDRGLRRGRVLDVAWKAAAYPPRVIPIDAHHAFGIVGDYNRATVYAVDVDHPDVTTDVASCTGMRFQYEPSSRVATWSDGSKLHFAHVDRDGALSAPATLEGATYEAVVLLDPARTHGAVAVLIDRRERSTILTPIDGFTDGGALLLGESREGKDVAWEGQLESGDYTPLGFGARPPAKSPDGALIAELVGPRITLRDHGVVRWTVAAPNVRDVVWTGDGDLIAVGEGLARIDLVTGALVERQSGWGFGLHETPGPATGAPICDAP